MINVAARCRLAEGRPGLQGRTLPSRGFTLLEVMIALAILGVSLVALAGINTGAMNMHAFSKRLTVATLLARSKMADIESKLQSDGLPSDDETEDGNFEADGYPEFKWRAEIIRPKTEDINTANLLAMTGTGLTGDSSGAAAGGPLAGLTGMLGGGAPGAGTGSGPATAGMGGMLGSAMQGQFQRMLDDLGKAMREVRLTVSWQNGKQVDKFTVVTHVVSFGPGSDQANVAAGQAPTMPGYGTPGGPMNPQLMQNLQRQLGGPQLRGWPPAGSGVAPLGGGSR